MPFLRLNGHTIPVTSNSWEEIPQIIGYPFQRAFDGTALTDRRGIKRRWRGRTTPLTEMAAEAIKGLLTGGGHYFPLDADTYSAAGLAASTNVSTLHALAADGASVLDHNGVAVSKFGNGSHSVESSTTNVLNAIATNGPNICTGTDTLQTTDGFTAVGGAAIATTTTHAWQGSRSLQVNCDASGASDDGVRTAFATVAANATVTGSVYVKATTSSVKLRIIQNSGAPAVLVTGAEVALTANVWRRIVLTGTLTGGNTTVALDVIEGTSASDLTFYCDGFQIEEKAYQTSWVNGTRAAGAVKYSNSLGGFYDATINFWLAGDSATLGTHRDIVSLKNDVAANANNLTIYRVASASTIHLQSLGADGTIQDISGAGDFDGTWRMYTGVVRNNPETGENALQLYKNGVSLATAATLTTVRGALASTDPINVGYAGNAAGTSVCDRMRIDELLIVPWAATVAQVLGWYNLGTAIGALPKLTMDGDCIRESTATVIGSIERISQVNHISSGWRNNGAVIDFILEEV